MDARERRGLLIHQPNPNGRLDYVVTVEGRTGSAADSGSAAAVVLRYVPDRQILQAGTFQTYLAALLPPAAGIEATANLILEDINDALVPRWVHVSVTVAGDSGPMAGAHQVAVEDRQPRWDNPGLLDRLERF